MDEALRIIILEDNPVDAKLVQFELQEAGLIFIDKVVGTKKDFLRELREFSPDLILSDYDLPQYSGALALKEAKMRCPDVPFILVTGAISEERAIETLTNGAKDYVMKSRINRLVPAVQRALNETKDHLERKKAEEELRKASLYSRTLIEASLDPLVTISSEGKVMDVNKAAEEITGVSKDQIIGSDFSVYFTEPEKAQSSYKRAFSEGSIKDFPLAIRHITGRISEVLYNATTYLSEKGEVQGVFAAARDVTELKKAEERLREAHNNLETIVEERTAALQAEMEEHKRLEDSLRQNQVLLKAVLNGTTDPVYVKDCDSRILMGNEALAKAVGKPLEEIVGKTDSEYYGNSEIGQILRENDLEIMTSGRSQTMEETILTPNGSRVFLSNKAPYRNASGAIIGIIGISTDITDRKKLEMQLNERTTSQENAIKELESFSYSVSHDLRAPLRAIDGYSRMLLKKYGDLLNEDATGMLEVIRDNTERMDLLIDGLLSFARVQQASMTQSEIDMDKLASEVWHDIHATHEDREFEVRIAKLLPGFGDGMLIRQVLFNLFANAAKFTKYKTPGIIEMHSYSDPGSVVYCLKDNGAGFDMAYYDKLFNVFQRLHSREEYEGTGVGLAVVQRIITRHGGRVWAEGELSKGATFYFALPHPQR